MTVLRQRFVFIQFAEAAAEFDMLLARDVLIAKQQYAVIETCSPGPYLELFARGKRRNWTGWGNQATDNYRPTWETYANHSAAERELL